ncbi:MAG: DUF3089 domain-containing protein [Gammaproteobacteria bacterium]
MKFIGQLIGALLVVTVVIAGIVLGQDWRLFQRYMAMPEDITRPEAALHHEPRATVGDGEGAPIPVASVQKLPPAAFEEAWAYAEETDTDALIVAYDGEIVFERYGPGVDQHTLFQSQSLHKGLTAIALGAAIANEAIPSMHTTAATYLTEWQVDPDKAHVTLADLAYMQAGLERPSYANHPFAPGIQLFLTGKLTERTLKTPSIAPSKSTYIWSNASTQALAIAVQRAVGKPWAEFLREALWQPIGGGEAYAQLDRPGGMAQAFCCLVSNARNWLRLGELLRNDGVAGETRLLPRGWVKAMTTGGAANPNYGMQLWVNEPYTGEFLVSGQPEFKKPRADRLGARDAFYIEGHFAQRLHVVPSAGLVVVRLGADVTDWDDAKLMNGLIAAAQDARRPTGLPPVPAPPMAFGDGEQPRAPDYGVVADWAAHPQQLDAADFDPQGVARTGDLRADAFYIYPTTYRGQTWNASLDDPTSNEQVDAVVQGQATILRDCCRIFAPRYRQAASSSVYDRTGSGIKAYGFAFEDVRAAFRQFVAASDRPFVILGHSQGALHTRRLLTEEIANTALVDRMVAAYVVGMPVPQGLFDGPWAGLKGCDSVMATGCVASWSTFGPGTDAVAYHKNIAQRYPQYVGPNGRVDIVCTNPLTGGTEAALADRNAGAVPIPDIGGYLKPPLPGLVGARCNEGQLVLTDNPGPPFQAMMFADENYHFYDVALFYANLRHDAVQRVTQWHIKAGAQ